MSDSIADVGAFFSFVEPNHCLFPEIDNFRRLLGAHPRYTELREIEARGSPLRVWRRLRVDTKGSGGPQVRYLRVWFASYEPDAPGGRKYLTFSYAEQGRKFDCFGLGSDPELRALPTLMERYANHADAAPNEFHLLRYVPYARATFRVRRELGAPQEIGKLVAHDGPAVSARLGSVRDAVLAKRTSFGVSQPTGMEFGDAVFYQDLLPGIPVTDILNAGNWVELLGRIGWLHGEMGGILPRGIETTTEPSHLKIIASKLALSDLFLPELRGTLVDAREAVAAGAATEARARHGFCHADFNLSQLLLDGDRWSVVDFDNCAMGDVHRDAAQFLGRLRECSFMRGIERADPAAAESLLGRGVSAYLDGYGRSSGRALDPQRLTFLELCGEIEGLSRLFRSDSFDRSRAEIRSRRIGNLAKRVRDGAAGT